MSELIKSRAGSVSLCAVVDNRQYVKYCKVLRISPTGDTNNSIFQYISNKMKHYTVYFIWKLLYMFQVVPQPIISSANNCI
jgi:hypothetical protein